MPTTDPEYDPPQDKVERTFELLTAAKKLESESNYWLATEKFVQAHELLMVLSGEENTKAEDIGGEGVSSEELERTQQIAQLYASKADEYWKQSRSCLMKAMDQEKTRDEQEQEQQTAGGDGADCNGEKSVPNPPGACGLLDDDQARARNRSFSVLFSRPIEEPSVQPLEAAETRCAPEGGPHDENPNDEIADEEDLETRLRALNQSLPVGFKTTDERMSDVHRGLGKLGMSSLYTQPKQEHFSNRFEDELPKSEDEQIDEILAQAQDEVMVNKLDRGGGDAPNAVAAAVNDDNDDSSFGDGDSESGDSEKDALLDNDQLAMKVIQKKIVKAQVKLAELLALVDQARSKRAKEDMDEEEEVFKNNGDDDDGDDTDKDDESFREVQKHDVAFLMMTGKKKLKSAQRDLRKAFAEWEEMIL